MTELPEIPRAEADDRGENEAETPEIKLADAGPYLEIPIIPKDQKL